MLEEGSSISNTKKKNDRYLINYVKSGTATGSYKQTDTIFKRN